MAAKQNSKDTHQRRFLVGVASKEKENQGDVWKSVTSNSLLKPKVRASGALIPQHLLTSYLLSAVAKQVNSSRFLVQASLPNPSSPVCEISRCVYHTDACSYKPHTCHHACHWRLHRASIWEQQKVQDENTECVLPATRPSRWQELCKVRSGSISVLLVRKWRFT